LNVTVTNPRGAGFVTVFPCGGAVPNSSNVNFGVGETIANAVVVKLAGGAVCLYTSAAADVIVDVSGSL
jgi:hypothetical protein